MAVATRLIKSRIKSVKNTRKITKAMELVSGSKMRKAIGSVLATRPYAGTATSLVEAILAAPLETYTHPLLRSVKHPKKSLLILIAADRGLAGGYTSNILKTALKAIKPLREQGSVDMITLGKRATDAGKKWNFPLIASFHGLTNNPKFKDILPIARMVIDLFGKEEYDNVTLCYTDFISAVSQQPVIVQLLPLIAPPKKSVQDEKEHGINVSGVTYKFEPSPKAVLEDLLPRLVNIRLYQALLEATASEHSARMMAMRNASDSAAEMIDDLTFTFNQARQAGITREIAEISSGKAALETA